MIVDIAPRRLPVTPGTPQQLQVTVTNTGEVIGGYALRVLGADPGWVDADRSERGDQTFSLFPAESRTMTPPAGSGVSLSTPPSFRARLLQTIMWPSCRCRQVGWSPVTRSSSALVGRVGGVHCSWSHAPSVSHPPGGCFFT